MTNEINCANFSSVLKEFSRLSKLATAEERQIKLDAFGGSDLFQVGSAQSKKYMRAPRPCSDALAVFVESCSIAHLHAMTALMYAGRDGMDDPVAYWGSDLVDTFSSGVDCSRAILEKSPRLEYMNAALNAMPIGFNLDGLPAAIQKAHGARM